MRVRARGAHPRHFSDMGQTNFWLFACFLGLVFLMGGGSRADILSQPIVRIASIIVLAVWAFQIRPDQIRRARPPLLFLAAAALIIAVQLVPLPQSVWGALSGREMFLEGFAIAHLEPVWRPMTLAPGRTLNTLLAMLPPFAAAVGLAVMRRDDYPRLVPLLLFLILVSAAIAVVQISTGEFYFFRITNEGSGVGLFANRNHQALLLALAFPLLGYFAAERHTDRRRESWRSWLAGMIAVLLVPMLLVTGSRAGLFLGLGGGVAAFAIAYRRQHAGGRRHALFRPSVVVPVGIVISASLATVYLSRDLSLQRLSGQSIGTEMRTENLDLYLEMARDFMPFGTGLGAFDPVFRIYEPHASLRQTYLNHAHNDFAQIAIEAGAAGLLLAAAFLGWIVYRSWRLWASQDGAGGALGRTGSAMAVLILVASLVDYPLRTPIHATLMIVAICFMMPWPAGASPRSRTTSDLEREPSSTTTREALSPNPAYRG